jgi:coatomer protein complex subunit epsilon
MADELYDVRNNLYLGNYHQAMAESTNAKPASRKAEDMQAFNVERDALVAQAQAGLGQFDLVANDLLKNATAPLLVATKHWVLVQKDVRSGGTGDDAYTALTNLAGDTPNAQNAPIAALAASAAIMRGDPHSALKLSMTWANALDASAHPRAVIALRALTVDGLLRINRVDLADKEVTTMRSIDDDAIPCIIANILTSLRAGATKPDRYGEAEVLVNEVVGRCGQSVSMLNLLALAKLAQGKAQEAEQHLLDALSKRSGDPETLANLAVASAQQGKPAEASLRFIGQAKAAGNSEWAKAYANMESRFDSAAATALN